MKKTKIGKTPSMPGMAPDESGRFEGSFASSSGTTLNLANHFLIAMPSMSDPIFGGTVVYICEHNDKGVLGVVINKPTDMTMEILFERIDLKIADGLHSDRPGRRNVLLDGGRRHLQGVCDVVETF